MTSKEIKNEAGKELSPNFATFTKNRAARYKREQRISMLKGAGAAGVLLLLLNAIVSFDDHDKTVIIEKYISEPSSSLPTIETTAGSSDTTMVSATLPEGQQFPEVVTPTSTVEIETTSVVPTTTDSLPIDDTIVAMTVPEPQIIVETTLPTVLETTPAITTTTIPNDSNIVGVNCSAQGGLDVEFGPGLRTVWGRLLDYNFTDNQIGWLLKNTSLFTDFKINHVMGEGYTECMPSKETVESYLIGYVPS